jgi:hypothetical protein
MKIINVEQLNSMFKLDANKGKLYWKNVSKYHNEKRGLEAGCVRSDKDGRSAYHIVKINGIPYKRSHIIFAMTQGRWASPLVDHINRNSLDDRPSNLREANHLLNARNHSRQNIRKVKTTGKYQVRLGKLQVGSFSTFVEAKAAYNTARNAEWGV